MVVAPAHGDSVVLGVITGPAQATDALGAELVEEHTIDVDRERTAGIFGGGVVEQVLLPLALGKVVRQDVGIHIILVQLPLACTRIARGRCGAEVAGPSCGGAARQGGAAAGTGIVPKRIFSIKDGSCQWSLRNTLALATSRSVLTSQSWMVATIQNSRSVSSDFLPGLAACVIGVRRGLGSIIVASDIAPAGSCRRAPPGPPLSNASRADPAAQPESLQPSAVLAS